jgi:hypothetical protein
MQFVSVLTWLFVGLTMALVAVYHGIRSYRRQVCRMRRIRARQRQRTPATTGSTAKGTVTEVWYDGAWHSVN